jgi:DNA-binding IclR family transcriptional regulator
MPRAGKRITPHALRVADALSRKAWRTAAEVAKLANVAPRTARLHLSTLVTAGTAEEEKSWPALTYRLKQ